jgi:hypothetical protein
VDGQEDDFDRDLLALQRAQDVEAVEPWHVYIEDGDIRPVRFDLLQGLEPVARFGHDFEPALRLNGLAQALTDNRVIVGHDDSDFSRHHSSFPACASGRI